MFDIKPLYEGASASLIFNPTQDVACGEMKVHNRGRRFGFGVRVTFLTPKFIEREFMGHDAKDQAIEFIETVWNDLMADTEAAVR